MDQVDRHRIKRLLVDLLRIRSANTVEVIHAVISGIFTEAIDLGHADKNPAYGLLKKILPPKNKRNLSEADPFSLHDRDRFLETAWAKLPEPFSLILETMAMSGMRLGEALAMSWENLDVRNCQHTYATILLMDHMSPAYVQKQLGHHSISMTVDIYGHWIPGEGRERLDKALRPKAKPGKSFPLVIQGLE